MKSFQVKLNRFVQKYKELKNHLSIETQNSEIEISNVDKKIAGLKLKQAEMESDYSALEVSWKERMSKSRQDV